MLLLTLLAHGWDQRIVVFGAGSAGCGISALIKQAMVEDGLTEEQARERFFLIDKTGLLTEDTPNLQSFQIPFAQPKKNVAHWQCEQPHTIFLKDAVQHVRPTLLIGVSAQAGAFTEDIIREMAKYVEHPIIFPLSNPQSNCEAIPEDIMKWTNEKAIIGTGSPFNEIQKRGKPFRIDQTNNCYIFPGMGLGLIAVKASHVTEHMFMIAAKTLANCSPTKTDPEANLLPPLNEIRQVSFKIAVAVAKEALATGLATLPNNINVETYILEKMWTPEYLPYKK